MSAIISHPSFVSLHKVNLKSFACKNQPIKGVYLFCICIIADLCFLLVINHMLWLFSVAAHFPFGQMVKLDFYAEQQLLKKLCNLFSSQNCHTKALLARQACKNCFCPHVVKVLCKRHVLLFLLLLDCRDLRVFRAFMIKSCQTIYAVILLINFKKKSNRVDGKNCKFIREVCTVTGQPQTALTFTRVSRSIAAVARASYPAPAQLDAEAHNCLQPLC